MIEKTGDVGLIVDQRRGRWTNTKPALDRRGERDGQPGNQPPIIIGDGLHMATMHPPPPHLNETKFFFGAPGYTEHEIEC